MRQRATLVVLPLLFLAVEAGGQPSRGGVQLQVPILAEQADASAVVLNPAQVGFLRGWSLTYLHSETVGGPAGGSGDGLFFGIPVIFGVALGAGVEWVRPPEGSGAWRSPVTVAASWRYRRLLSLGVASRWVASSGDLGLDGLWALDLGLSLRLGPYLALALTAHGVNDPRAASGNEADRLRFGREWSGGLVLRPLRRDWLSLATEASYAEALGRLTLRGAVVVRPTAGWALRADVSGWFDDGETGLALALATELSLSAFTLGGGGRIVGLEDGGASYGGFTVLASAGGGGVPAVWRPRRVVQLLLSGRLDTRALARLEDALARASEDPSVAGVLVQPRGGFSVPIAIAEELRWSLGRVQRSGRPVACYLEDATGSAYYLCAGANRVLVNSSGGIRLAGLRMTTLYLGEALDRLGVSFEILRVGEYKGAPEQLTGSGPSAPVREATEDFLGSVSRRFVWDLARDRDVSTARMMELIDGGPYLADEAVTAGLADRALHADELEDALAELYDGRVRFDDGYLGEPIPERAWGGGDAIAVVHIDGDIVDGESFEAGPSWLRMAGARTVARAVGEAASSRRVKAIVLRIDSPGGSAYGSEVLWRAVREAARRKPVVASLGGVATSGGYYVASAADEIVAAPATLTGSIGIFYAKVEVSGLMEKIGVHPFHYKRGRRAGFGDWSRRWTVDEREALSRTLHRLYDRFLDRVEAGREAYSSRDEVEVVARGRIWSGARAKGVGLVDTMGGLQHAIERAADRAGLSGRPEVLHLPRRQATLAERAVDLLGLRAGAETPMPPVLERALEAAAPFAYVEPSTPMALLPFAYELEAD